MCQCVLRYFDTQGVCDAHNADVLNCSAWDTPLWFDVALILSCKIQLQGEERLEQLQKALRKVYLRRTKAIIADQLPTKRDIIVFCRLKPLQYRCGS